MQCFKCGKEMDREDGGPTLKGIDIRTSLPHTNVPSPGEIVVEYSTTQETIDYNNIQLGKYSDGMGECHVAICYECYIDGLFHFELPNNVLWFPKTKVEKG